MKGECLTQCLEMMQGSVDYLRANVKEGSEWKKELGMIDLEYFLSHPKTENQLAALCFTEKIMQFIDLEREEQVVLSIFKALEKFSVHKNVSCRQKMYAIMRLIYENSEHS